MTKRDDQNIYDHIDVQVSSCPLLNLGKSTVHAERLTAALTKLASLKDASFLVLVNQQPAISFNANEITHRVVPTLMDAAAWAAEGHPIKVCVGDRSTSAVRVHAYEFGPIRVAYMYTVSCENDYKSMPRRLRMVCLHARSLLEASNSEDLSSVELAVDGVGLVTAPGDNTLGGLSQEKPNVALPAAGRVPEHHYVPNLRFA